MADVRLLDSAGRPVNDYGDPGAAVPHVLTFANILNSISQTYSFRRDEALRHLPDNALAMRRDCYIRALLQERSLPTVNREWVIKVENPQDPVQKATQQAVTAVVKKTPHLRRMFKYLMEAEWYGCYAAQVVWRQQAVLNNPRWCVTSHKPVNGDKIAWGWDDTPAVFINTQGMANYPKDSIVWTDRVPALKLEKESWRRQFIIHTHEVDDADYFEGEMAGSVHGVGLRGMIYWGWWLRDELLSWAVDFMKKVGALGLLVFPYEMGNETSKQQAEANAKKASTSFSLTIPVTLDNRMGKSLEPIHIPANTTGIEALQKMIDSYFERHMERLIVGQSMSSGADTDGSLGGTGKAEFAKDTKWQITKWGAENLAETLSSDMIGPIMRYNWPQYDFPVWFEFVVEKPDAADRVAAIGQAITWGLPVRVDDAYEALGVAKPELTDEVIQGPPQPDPDGNPPPGGGGEKKPGGDDDGDESMDFAARVRPDLYAADAGRWITIGAKPGKDGKKHGGTPVFIQNGRITKGHPSLTGKKIDALKEPETHPVVKEAAESIRRRDVHGTLTPERAYQIGQDEWFNRSAAAKAFKSHKEFGAAIRAHLFPDEKPVESGPTHRQQVKQSKDYARAVWAKKARAEGVKPEHLHQLAAEIIAHSKAAADEHNSVLREAREMSKGKGFTNLQGVHLHEGKRDADMLKGFDEIADHIERTYPGMFGDESRGSTADQLLERLMEGNRQPASEDEAYEQALDALLEDKHRHKSAPPAGDDDEEIPFRGRAVPDLYAGDWDESKHPRDSGKFAHIPGGAAASVAAERHNAGAMAHVRTAAKGIGYGPHIFDAMEATGNNGNVATTPREHRAQAELARKTHDSLPDNEHTAGLKAHLRAAADLHEEAGGIAHKKRAAAALAAREQAQQHHDDLTAAGDELGRFAHNSPAVLRVEKLLANEPASAAGREEWSRRLERLARKAVHTYGTADREKLQRQEKKSDDARGPAASPPAETAAADQGKVLHALRKVILAARRARPHYQTHAEALRKVRAGFTGEGMEPHAKADAPELYGWDESQHPRGQPENAGEFGPGGGSSGKPSGKVAKLLGLVAKVPKGLAAKVGRAVSSQYQKLEGKYGKTGARLVMGGMVALLPVPAPGTSLLPVAIAEAVRRLGKLFGGGEKPAEQYAADEPKPDFDVDAAAKAALADLYREMGEEPPA